MRIAIDLSPLHHSGGRGIGLYARSLLQALGRVAPEHEYILVAAAPIPDLPLPPHHELHFLPAMSLHRASALVGHQLILPRILRRGRIDLLHILGITVHPSHPLPPLWKTNPVVVTLHDLIPLHSPPMLRKRRWRLYYRLALWQCGRADAVITDSEWTRRDALRVGLARSERIVVAPLAAPPFPDQPAAFEVPEEPYALHVGGDDWNKNREAVLEAFARIAPESCLRLILVGGTAPRHDALPDILRERVEHHPSVERAELRQLYAGATVFVFPSRYEGFGLPILEAMAAGAPVITSDQGAMREVAGNAALLVNPESPAAIAEAMSRIEHDPEAASRLRLHGRERAAEFSWERTARETLRAYELALRGPRA